MKPAFKPALKPALSQIAATVLLLAATAACAQTPPPAETPAPVTAPPPTNIEGQQPVLPLRAHQHFICGDGQMVTLEHDQPAGILRGVRGGETFTLQEQVGYTPPRFVTGSDSVVLDGDIAKLRRGRAIAEQTCRRVPAEPVAGTVWGTLTKLDRMGLPPGTRAKVLLVDGARMDAPAVELGSTTLTTTGNQVPLNFILSYDPARTAAPASPLLQARIETAKGELLYITDTANTIPNEGAAPSPIELTLVRASGK